MITRDPHSKLPIPNPKPQNLNPKPIFRDHEASRKALDHCARADDGEVRQWLPSRHAFPATSWFRVFLGVLGFRV